MPDTVILEEKPVRAIDALKREVIAKAESNWAPMKYAPNSIWESDGIVESTLNPADLGLTEWKVSTLSTDAAWETVVNTTVNKDAYLLIYGVELDLDKDGIDAVQFEIAGRVLPIVGVSKTERNRAILWFRDPTYVSPERSVKVKVHFKAGLSDGTTAYTQKFRVVGEKIAKADYAKSN